MKANQNMNIPTISVDMMVSKLGGLYSSAINGGVPIRCIPSSFLWGAPGVGKSDGVRQIADKITAETGKQTCVTDVRLLLFSPIDLRGVPMADQSRQFTEWLRPKIFDLDPSENVINIVFWMNCPPRRRAYRLLPTKSRLTEPSVNIVFRRIRSSSPPVTVLQTKV